MAGYLSPSNTNTSGLTYDALLYCKTNIGGYFFDGFMKLNHTIRTEVTQNPVETGASMVDHAYVKPVALDIEIKMSNVLQSLVPGQFSNSWSRSVSAWQLLRQLQNDRIPMSVFTKLQKYDNMIIQELKAQEDSSTIYGLNATVSLVEIPIARVKTVKISSAPQTTESTNLGQEEVESIDESILSRMGGDFGLVLNKLFYYVGGE